MKKRNLLFFSLLLAVCWPLHYASTGSQTETISPSNLSPEVKFYSEHAGEFHTLTVNVASGYRFKSGPSLSLNPESLWSKTGENTFVMSDMEDRTEITATVTGVIVPTGGGGDGGSPPEYPFDVTMLTRYFRMWFTEPQESVKVLAPDSQETVAVTLVNAIGAPASGQVTFSTDIGSFGLNATVNVTSGVASSTLNTAAEGGMKDKITADASSIDITDGKTASGSVESHEIAVPKVELEMVESVLTIGEENTYTVIITPQGVESDNIVFEIRRASASTWHEMASQSELELERKMGAAGKFKVRADVDFGAFMLTSVEQDFEAQFPSYGDIVSDSDASLAFNGTWQATLDATSNGSRREYGFWVRYNSDEEQYEFTELTEGPEFGNDADASIDLGSRPADDPASPSPLDMPIYTVGSFHTHTPTTEVQRISGPNLI